MRYIDYLTICASDGTDPLPLVLWIKEQQRRVKGHVVKCKECGKPVAFGRLSTGTVGTCDACRIKKE